MPLLVVQTNNHHLAITEADLENYAGMFLKAAPTRWSVFRIDTTVVSQHWPEKITNPMPYKSMDPCLRPWRVIMVADNAPALLHNNLVLNLNDPCAIEDPSWIQARHDGMGPLVVR